MERSGVGGKGKERFTNRWPFSFSSPWSLVRAWPAGVSAPPACAHSSAYTSASGPSLQTCPCVAGGRRSRVAGSRGRDKEPEGRKRRASWRRDRKRGEAGREGVAMEGVCIIGRGGGRRGKIKRWRTELLEIEQRQ